MKQCVAILLLVCTAAPTLAGEKSTAKRLAVAIAPFVNERTFGVGHVDISRVPWAKIRNLLVKSLPYNKRDLEQLDDGFAFIKELNKAGVTDVFYVLDMDSIGSGPIGVIPISKKMNVKAIWPFLNIFGAKKMRRAFVIAEQGDYDRWSKFKPKHRPDLEQALSAAGDVVGRAVAIPPPLMRKAFIEMIPELPPKLGGGRTRQLADGFLWSVSQVTFDPELTIQITWQTRDVKSAKALQACIPPFLKLVEEETEVKEMVPDYAKLIRLIEIQRRGTQLTATLNRTFFEELVRQFKDQIKKSVPIAEENNNLRQIAVAMLDYHDQQGHFPAAANYDAKGKPLLSWRVHILPYIEQRNLYQQFRLNEPWNSPHNKKLISEMPKIYESPFAKLPDGKTTYVIPVGKGTIFDGKKGISIREITDGTSNTLMILAVNDANAVIWTKPVDFDVTAKAPLKRLLRPMAKGFHAAFADGSTSFIKREITLKTLRALFTRAGGEIASLP